MVPTVDLLVEKFHLFNKTVFNSALDSPPIKLSKAKSYLGMVRYRRRRNLWGRERKTDFVIIISTYRDLAENEIEDVLLHEMIHYYIGVNHIADTSAHGKVFRQMMSDINNRFNRHITISLRSETTKIAESAPRSITFFCIIRMRNGRTGIMPVAKTRIFKIWDMLQTSSDIAEAQWYASRAAFFAKYPKFRTAKIIYVDEKVLSLHLAGAMPLVKTGNVIKPAKNKAG